jgi:hypothetical protein
VPNAPFRSDWHELVLKRMLRHAAENGYDQLAWTTGDQQAARYDLSKQIQGLNVYQHPDGSYDLSARKMGDGSLVDLGSHLPESKLADYVGKDLAERIIRGEGTPDPSSGRWRSFSGLDLKIGGDWAKALYDRAIPNFLNKYAKKWGAKVGETEISTTDPGSLRYEIVDPRGNVQDAFRNRPAAEQAIRDYNENHAGRQWTVVDTGKTEKVHSIEITPAMKKSVLHEGQRIAKNLAPKSPRLFPTHVFDESTGKLTPIEESAVNS